MRKPPSSDRPGNEIEDDEVGSESDEQHVRVLQSAPGERRTPRGPSGPAGQDDGSVTVEPQDPPGTDRVDRTVRRDGHVVDAGKARPGPHRLTGQEVELSHRTSPAIGDQQRVVRSHRERGDLRRHPRGTWPAACEREPRHRTGTVPDEDRGAVGGHAVDPPSPHGQRARRRRGLLRPGGRSGHEGSTASVSRRSSSTTRPSSASGTSRPSRRARPPGVKTNRSTLERASVAVIGCPPHRARRPTTRADPAGRWGHAAPWS